MWNILIKGATFSKNKGSSAMLISTIKMIKGSIPNTNITVFSIFPDLDKKNSGKYDVRIIGQMPGLLSALLQILSIFIWKFSGDYFSSQIGDNRSHLREHLNSDIIIDLSGDSFTDNYGVLETLSSCWNIILCKLINKPIVIFAQSIGPFNNIITKRLSRFCLNNVDLLIVREEITQTYLRDIGVTNRIYLTADSAFLLEPAPNDKIYEILLRLNIDQHDRPIIGISVSQLIYKFDRLKTKDNSAGNSYIHLMATLVNYLVNKLNAQVIFVPHVTNDDNSIDDRFVASMVYNLVFLKERVKLINEDCSPDELKGIIGECDLFIGARMHANIAATSMCVPTLAIAYSHKFYGIMKMLGMENYVINHKDLNEDELLNKINDLWDNRISIRNLLSKNVKVVKERSMCNIKLLNDFLKKLP